MLWNLELESKGFNLTTCILDKGAMHLLIKFLTVRKMEAEVVQMCVNMFRGGKDACGTVCILGNFVFICSLNTQRQHSWHVKASDWLC